MFRGPVGRPRGAGWAVYRLLLRSVATKGRLVAVGLLSLAVVAVAATVGTRPYDTLVSATRFADSGLTLLLPVGCLVFASAALGDLIDDGSLVYLWLRPLSPRLPVLCAWLVTVTICLPLIGVPLLVSAVLMDGSAELLSGVTVSVLVGIRTERSGARPPQGRRRVLGTWPLPPRSADVGGLGVAGRSAGGGDDRVGAGGLVRHRQLDPAPTGSAQQNACARGIAGRQRDGATGPLRRGTEHGGNSIRSTTCSSSTTARSTASTSPTTSRTSAAAESAAGRVIGSSVCWSIRRDASAAAVVCPSASRSRASPGVASTPYEAAVRYAASASTSSPTTRCISAVR